MKAIGDETPQTLETILRQRQSGVSDLALGNQIVELFRRTSSNVNEVTNQGYKQIEDCNYDWYNREQALKHWRYLRHKSLTELTSNIEKYAGQDLARMESSIFQLIKEGSSNFRNESEMYLGNDESTFAKLKEDTKVAMEQVAYKFSENDGGKCKGWKLIARFIEQN